MRDDAMLRQLARCAGVGPEWTDQTGALREVSPETLRAILRALGFAADSDAEIRDSIASAESWRRKGPEGLITGRVGEPVAIPAPETQEHRVVIIRENGAREIVEARREGDRLVLPAIHEPGYHRAQMGEREITLAIAPHRCVTFADLSGGRTGWGAAAQIYSLRTPLDGGIGHFGGVATLARAAAARGADALAVSPVHALYGALPDHFSPYSPSTRLFYNPLHADPCAALPAARVAELARETGLSEEMERLSAFDQIDWPAATVVKQRLLLAICATLEADGGDPDLQRYIGQATPLLRDHAIFEALHASELTRDPGVRSWRDWLPGFRDPASPDVAAFAAAHAEEVRYQLFLQWLTERSYGAAQAACRDAGMRVGLIADLAIGMDGAGSHAWSRQDDILHGLSIGAPPDYYSAEGQNWALTTFSPRGLLTSGFSPFIDTLRANLRHAGGVRIDHVMGMSRLWLIPAGATALEGAYVSLPSEDMFRLVALESFRHQAIIIGEDLGTLPHGFRPYLQDQGVAGLRVLRFERTQHGHVPPWEWDAGAVALTSTHDLAPTAGWWAGADIAPGDEAAEAGRAWDRGIFWGACVDAGIAHGERPAPVDTDPVVDVAVRYVAATPCTLKIIPIEDVMGLRVQPNVPGTTTEKPNWRHRLPGEAADAFSGERIGQRLAPLGARGTSEPA